MKKMTKDERIKELETITMRLFDMVHEGNLAELQIEANELYPRIVNNGVLDGVIKCEHTFGERGHHGDKYYACIKCGEIK